MAKRTLEARIDDLERRTKAKTKVIVVWSNDDLQGNQAGPDDIVVTWDDVLPSEKPCKGRGSC